MPRPRAVMISAGCSCPQGPPDCSLHTFYRDILIQDPEEVPLQNYHATKLYECFPGYFFKKKCRYLQSYYSHVKQYRKINYKWYKWLSYYIVLRIFTPFVDSLQVYLDFFRWSSVAYSVFLPKRLSGMYQQMQLLTYSLPFKTVDSQLRWKM